jgi:hypothetical protein
VEHLGVLCVQNGVARPILSAQAHYGFAHMEENVMSDLLLSKKLAVPKEDADGYCRRTDLQIACLHSVCPDMLDVDAHRALHRAFMEEHPDLYREMPVSLELLSSLVSNVEARKLAAYGDEITKCKAKLVLQKNLLSRKLPKLFKPAPCAKYTAGDKKLPRWLPKKNSCTKDVTAFICLRKPPSIFVMEDDYNGRWRVISPDGVSRSISWTKRGYAQAAAEVLYVSWELEANASGQAPPFDLAELAKEFAEEF